MLEKVNAAAEAVGLEPEIASAARFILEKAGNPKPYYWSISESFFVPAVYFPQPEITSDGDTLLTYALSYMWFVKFFHRDTQSAYAMGAAVLNALQSNRNAIPLFSEQGELTGRVFRMRDPSLKPLDCAAQLTLTWNSPRPYYAEQTQKMMTYQTAAQVKSTL